MNQQDLTTLTFKGVHGRDEFRREQVAERVIKLLTADIDVSPMVIDGDWGTGKTEFCHKLINKFKEDRKNYRLLYVDAFQADHADNPLVTVLSGVISLLPEDSTKATLLQKAMPVVRFAATTASKAVVSHILKQSAEDLTDGLENHLKNAADQAIDSSIKALLKDHEESKKNLQSLQDSLANIAKENPIVIFIDELDRCRPDFAVQMLEIIKHTFNVEGVQFVLVTNKRQLKAAINHRYGHQVDAQRYLEKFLKFSFYLPDFVIDQKVREDDRTLVAIEHFSGLLSKSEALKETDLAGQKDGVYGFARAIIQQNLLSLREVETFVRHLEIYHQLSQGLAINTIWGYQLLRIFGVFVFCFKQDISESIVKNKANADSLAGLLGISSLPEYKSQSYRHSYLHGVAVMLAQSCAIGNTKYFPPDDQEEEKKYWKEEKFSYFRSGRGGPYHMHDPVKETILCLQLGSV
ncbi:KAP family P-loop NTPase fold protein [Delftia tsuruhatensis]|uniref:P-loop NTPase fold protein n=1 Tax=Delftia tsuruhatensis TaxID=180282 RepID=A0AAX3SSD8_9BURK|nr:P-loop NTPase fold protein [Delftia tsuruhatensis]WFF82864.1 P-loop NTPase fold protein [Delftia tsuruhatensis]